MTYKRLFWGTLLMIFGLLLLLKNLDLIHFNWHMIWHMWPIVFILWGISLLPVKDLIKVALSLVTIGVGLGLVSNSNHSSSWRIWDNDWEVHVDRDYDDEEYDSDSYSDQVLNVEWENGIDEAELRLDAAAGTFDIKGVSDDYLVEFKKHGNIGNYEMDTFSTDDKEVVSISLESNRRRFKNLTNSVDIWLNQNPVWDLDVDAGAAALDLDLREFKVKKINLDNGASDVKLQLGDRFDLTKVEINSGVSDITVYIPETSACHLKTSTFLTGKTLPGFSKQGDGTYVTENFDDSSKKIYVEVSAAISSIKIKRY
ncbi:MAG: hypothetical protein JEZ03_00610 [Bacteroidales bacterium]|nr:hypothetical protein [Bacteroidales bacterium]